MNKKMKRIRIMYALAMAIDHSMKVHTEFNKEYCDSSSFFGCCNGGHCSNCSGDCKNCNSCKCHPSSFMVSFYDHEHNRLVGNWLWNSFQSYPPIRPRSSLIDDLAYELDIDIEHLMWEHSDELLHQVRYVRIGLRDETYEKEKNDFHIKDVGIEYKIFEGSVDLKWEDYEEEYYFKEGEEK